MKLRTAESLVASLILLLACLCTAPAVARAPRGPGDLASPLRVLSESAVYHAAPGRVTFKVIFDQQPDFSTVDSFGRMEDQFQYYIIGDSAAEYPLNFDAVITVEQPWISQSRLAVRSPDINDPNGWGTLVATIPFRLKGGSLRFSVPLSTINSHSADGGFTYQLQTLSFGAQNDFRVSEATRKLRGRPPVQGRGGGLGGRAQCGSLGPEGWAVALSAGVA